MGRALKVISAIAALALVAIGIGLYYYFATPDPYGSLKSYVISTGAGLLTITGVWWFWWVTREKFALFWNEIFAPFSADERLHAFLKGCLDILQYMLVLAILLASAQRAKGELLHVLFAGGLFVLAWYVTSFLSSAYLRVVGPIRSWGPLGFLKFLIGLSVVFVILGIALWFMSQAIVALATAQS
jgi:hypothetical protein